MRKARSEEHPFILVEEEKARIPPRGWAEIIRKVYEVDPMVCPQCGETMKVIAFITDFPVVGKIINHFKLAFVPERPPPPHMISQKCFLDSETAAHYDLSFFQDPQGGVRLISGIFWASPAASEPFLPTTSGF